MITSYDIFIKMVKESGVIPTLEEWLKTGYKRTMYYEAKKRYKADQEELLKTVKTNKEAV